jgi:hypothetical protein
MANFNIFNTGRQYAPGGQIIVWAQQGENGPVWFVDVTRGIDGQLSAPAFGSVTNDYVRSAYDRGAYTMPGNWSEFMVWRDAAEVTGNEAKEIVALAHAVANRRNG